MLGIGGRGEQDLRSLDPTDSRFATGTQRLELRSALPKTFAEMRSAVTKVSANSIRTVSSEVAS